MIAYLRPKYAAVLSLLLLILQPVIFYWRTVIGLRSHIPFDIEGYHLGQIGYDPNRRQDFLQRLEDRLSRSPGIRAASLSGLFLLTGDEWDGSTQVEGYHPTGEGAQPHFNSVGEKYFQTLGMRIVQGRAFTTRDTNGAPKVAIVNAKFAKKYFGDTPAIGKHIGLGGDPTTKLDTEIIGVVNDARYENLRKEIPEQVFISAYQGHSTDSNFYVSYDRDAASAFGTIRSVIHQMEPNVPIANLKTFDRQLEESLISERLTATLGTVFGVLATGLVLIGLYGVMSFVVTRRSREIGIRMALGALQGSVVWIVMREVLILVGGGIAIGLPTAYALARVVRGQLYGIDPGDPMSIALATLLLVAVTCFAGYIPARRAATFDPLRILRYE